MDRKTIAAAARFWGVSEDRAKKRLNYQEGRELETSEGELGWHIHSENGPIWITAFDF